MVDLPVMHGSFIVCCLIESAQSIYIRFFSFYAERYAHALFIHLEESDFPFSRNYSGKEISLKCCSLVKICAPWVSNYSGKVPLRTDCSSITLKPAHLSPYLPTR